MVSHNLQHSCPGVPGPLQEIPFVVNWSSLVSKVDVVAVSSTFLATELFVAALANRTIANVLYQVVAVFPASCVFHCSFYFLYQL